jgi:uncharacterized protein YbaP (TraB family)
VLLLVAACGREQGPPPVEDGPALLQVQGHGLDGWLFGTIHVLPRGVDWRTGDIDRAIGDADRLVLESAEIQDSQRTRALFEKMGRSPGLPPLEARVPASEQAELRRVADDGGADLRLMSGYESWAAAMLLSAAAQQSLHLSASAGVETVLIEAFRDTGKPINGLETVARQFGAFDTLPEASQRRLLTQTVAEAEDMKALYERILKAWLKGDMAAIAREEQVGERPDPAVEQAVLVARNRDWSVAIAQLRGRPFIAVGTGHLTGRDNLISLLEERGYRMTRVQ